MSRYHFTAEGWLGLEAWKIMMTLISASFYSPWRRLLRLHQTAAAGQWCCAVPCPHAICVTDKLHFSRQMGEQHLLPDMSNAMTSQAFFYKLVHFNQAVRPALTCQFCHACLSIRCACHAHTLPYVLCPPPLPPGHHQDPVSVVPCGGEPAGPVAHSGRELWR
jgi:hypothetical protein